MKKSVENGKKPIEMRSEDLSLNELFPQFVAAKTAEGVSEGTVKNYHQHWHSIGKHLDRDKLIGDVTQDDINNVVVSMRKSGLAHNSISSYTRVLRTFLKWCREQDYTSVVMPPIKDKETIKETYTDEHCNHTCASYLLSGSVCSALEDTA